MDTVYIHADESCLGNQHRKKASPGGAAGLLEVWKDGAWERRDYWISEPDTTNNRMALRSLLEPLAALRRRCRVVFTSDSQYLVKGINEWRHGWKRAGWKRKTGAIANVELWKAVDAAVSRHDLSAHWVRGHQGHPENEFADWLAKRAAADKRQSGGLVTSVYTEWLEEQREKGRLLDVMEFEPPETRYGA